MRCPACGARNPADAAWCTQCFGSLVAEGSDAAPTPDTTAPVPVAVTAPPSPAPPARPRAVGGRFREGTDGVDWCCVACDSWNPMAVVTCPACGTAFADTLRAADAADSPVGAARSDADARRAMLASTVLPGLGHWVLGHRGSAVARVVLFAFCTFGAVALGVAAASSSQSILPALPLAGGAIVVWAGSLLDVQSVAQGRGDVVLRPRTYLWLVLGVIGLLMLSLLGAALGVRG